MKSSSASQQNSFLGKENFRILPRTLLKLCHVPIPHITFYQPNQTSSMLGALRGNKAYLKCQLRIDLEQLARHAGKLLLNLKRKNRKLEQVKILRGLKLTWEVADNLLRKKAQTPDFYLFTFTEKLASVTVAVDYTQNFFVLGGERNERCIQSYQLMGFQLPIRPRKSRSPMAIYQITNRIIYSGRNINRNENRQRCRRVPQ